VIEPWLEGLHEGVRATVFAGLDMHATVRVRRILEAHPLRPESTPRIDLAKPDDEEGT
jgi:hypothetical protein